MEPNNLNPIPEQPDPVSMVSEVEPEKPKSNIASIILSLLLIILVGVVAFLAYQNYQLQKQVSLLTASVETSPTPVATADPTTNWKTYANKNLSFKYPSGGTVTQTNNTLRLTYPPDNQVISFIFHKSINKSLKDYINETYLPNRDGNYTLSQAAPVEIAGYNGYQATTQIVDSGFFGYVVLESNDKKDVVDIEYSPPDDEVAIKTFDQILSTFKFLGTSSSPAAKACTEEAKLCPDGSYVGRTGPNCEFSACPSP